MEEKNLLETNKLYVLSGVAGVGKSTFLKNLNIPDYCIISTDSLRESILGSNTSFDEYGKYESIPQNANNLVFETLNKILEFRMKQGLTTFIDATNLKDVDRANYVRIAKKYNIESEILIFGENKSIEEIKLQNTKREKRVPEYVIDRMYEELEKTSNFPYRLIDNNLEYKFISKNNIPNDIELFVIGDIHGMYDELEKLLKQKGFYIEDNCIFGKTDKQKVLFVGDIVDRGYDSIKILELVKNSIKYQNHYMVLGNHENKLLTCFEQFTNNEKTTLFLASEAVTRTFHEFLELSKEKQLEYYNFLKSLPFYYTYKDNLIVHANIENGNILQLNREDSLYGIEGKNTDLNYKKLYDEGINKFKLIRGHVPSLDKNDVVICLEEEAVSKGNLCMYDVNSNEIIKQKSEFDYNKELEVYKGKNLLYKFEELKSYLLPKYDKENKIIGSKETSLISYKHNDTETLRIYKYDKKVFFNNLWHLDPLLTRARGLVLDSNGQIIQNPFTKVFNFNENGSGLDIPNDKEVIAATKENGFLGCITKWNNELLITTTGSFDSDFTNYIKDFIMNKNFEHYDHKLYGNLMKFLNNNDMTLMFEVIHPNDPHIIKYEKEEMGLRLIGARGKNINDKELPEEKLDEIGKLINVKRPEWFKIEYGELKNLVKSSQLEGYMVRDIDTQETLLKFKTPYYLTTKFIGRMSTANINFMYSNPNKFKENVDEEYYQLVDLITSKIEKDKFLSYENNSKIEIVRDLINESREDLENTAFNLEK